MAVSAIGAPPRIIHVDWDAPGSNNGTSWQHAYHYLQDALARARAGDTICVAGGVYRPRASTGQVTGGRNATFNLINGVTLQGGYAGYGAADPHKRNIILYKTILSGDLNNDDALEEINDVNLVDDLLDDPTRQDNCYSVVTADKVASDTVLDGFIITGGNANGPQQGTAMTRGGGIYISESSPTIQSCVFQANAARENGGALHAKDSDPAIIECTFISNYCAQNSGAVSLMDADAQIAYCYLSYNQAGDSGGAVSNDYGKSSIVACTLTENRAAHHGGAMTNYYSDVLVTACTFIRNQSDSKGGAVYNNFSSAYNNDSPVFTDCQFIDNTTGMRGGAVQNSWCNTIQTNCIFVGNLSTDEGGAVYNDHSAPTYVNCLFNMNHADIAGGALCNFDTNAQVINCTFFANTASQGRAVASTDTTITHSLIQVANSILWDQGNEIAKDNSATQVSATYSNIYGSYQGTGNVFVDPRFTNALGPDGICGTPDDNLRLADASPCIDAAEYAAVPVDVNTDLDGKPRFLDDPATVDTGHGTPPMVDMGAYEFQLYDPNDPAQCGPTPPIADAGTYQTVYTWTDGYALVSLDGSNSFDPDGDHLLYSWSWTIDDHVYHDGGDGPTIECPVGEHVIELIVSDCAHISMPAHTIVTVTGPMQTVLWLHPSPVKRDDADQQHVLGMLYVYGKAENDIDLTAPLTIYPGGVEAVSQYAYESQEGGLLTTVIGMFDKNQVLDVFAANGYYDVSLVGRLHTGQVYFGMDQIWITD